MPGVRRLPRRCRSHGETSVIDRPASEEPDRQCFDARRRCPVLILLPAYDSLVPITVKINNDEPQIVKRLHEEPYRNVIRLVTLLLEWTPASDPQQSMTETKTVSVQLDKLLSPAEKAALTSYYPDKRLKISEARRIMVQFATSKGTMLIKIMMDDPAIRKLVKLCQSQ